MENSVEQNDRPEPQELSQDITSESNAPEAVRTRAKPGRQRKLWRFVKGASTLVLVLFCLVIGMTVGYLHRTSDLFKVWLRETQKHPGAVLTHPTDPLAAFHPDVQMPPQSQHRVNLLLIGADSDYEEARPVALKNTYGRSDALMVVQIDFDSNKLSVLSIPRDTAVFIPDNDSRVHKINSAHAYGGPRLTQRTVESAFGIHTDYYLSLNFEAFQKVVNAIDGVDLDVGPKALDYDDNWGHLHIHLKPGFQHLDGYKAMGYVRMRHADDDVHRAQRQHEFMEAMRAKITNRDTFLKLPNALNQITQNIASDLTPAQQLTIANFARTVPPQNLLVATLPSTVGKSFVYANVPESERLISRLFFSDQPDSVKVTVPDQARSSSRRTLLARLNSPGHRRRHRRRRVVPAVHKEILGVILNDRNRALALNRQHPGLSRVV
ncbi:MAG: transcriptional attenuator, LytR family [Chthonomonadaceae bacterium]|nr:transcriptional attenuator, LytR family [Chthonomonadaceae bacterium]